MKMNNNSNAVAGGVDNNGGDSGNGNLDLIVGNGIDLPNPQVGRMRSLPILNKQTSGSVPVSARDKNPN